MLKEFQGPDPVPIMAGIRGVSQQMEYNEQANRISLPLLLPLLPLSLSNVFLKLHLNEHRQHTLLKLLQKLVT